MKLVSTEAIIPSKAVTNENLIDEIIEKSKDSLSRIKLKLAETLIRQGFKRSGTQVRYIREPGEKAIDLAVQAGKNALAKANMKPEEIDLLIFTGVGRGWLEPAMANVFQSLIGLKNATCFDVMDACASWLRSMSIAKCFLDQGVYKNIMILNSEFNNKEFSEFVISDTRTLRDSFAQFTMGEAATATIVTKGNSAEEQKNFYFTFKTWGEKHDLCKIPLPNIQDYIPEGARKKPTPLVFFAKSSELLTFAVDKATSHFKADPKLHANDYDAIFLHDVSEYSTSRIIKKMKLDEDKVFRTHARFGNTVSATIPLGIHMAAKEGVLKPGMDVLLVCGSAGVSTGFSTFRY